MRSYEDSLTRMGLNRIDALLIHDLDHGYHGTDEGVQARIDELDAGGGYRALAELKERGEIGAIGAGINVTGMIPRFLERFDLDFFLVAMPYTLLNQGALDAELPLVQSRGATIVIGAVFASGILAIGPVPGATYGYQPATPEILEKARRIQEICQQYDVPLGRGGVAVPVRAPGRLVGDPGAERAGAGEGEPGLDARRDPGRPLGRPEGARAAAPGRPDAVAAGRCAAMSEAVDGFSTATAMLRALRPGAVGGRAAGPAPEADRAAQPRAQRDRHPGLRASAVGRRRPPTPPGRAARTARCWGCR